MQHIKEKKERALGVKLFLKSDRCNSPKCVMVRRPARPGVHGAKRHTVTDFGKQLQEKQKIQIVYGLNNRQMRNLFRDNSKEELVKILESRLDRVVFMAGLAKSPRIARQLVSHGHITVNARKVTIPSYKVRVGDKVTIRPESRASKIFEEMDVRLKNINPPEWLKLDKEKLSAECVARPEADYHDFAFDVDLVGQFYSR